MSNLIRAEFYRLKHSSRLFAYIIGLCFGGVVTTFMSNSPGITRQVIVGTAPMAMVLSLIAVGISIGRHYQNRTAYYEVMDGASAHRIILSRICVYVPLMVGFYFIPVSAILIYFDGDAELVRFLSMILIIFLRLLIFTICACLIFKTVGGAILPYVRFMIEMWPLMIIVGEGISISDDRLFSVLCWLPFFQCCSLGGEIDNVLIIKIIVGFAVEAAVMYALAYISHRRKWLIKTLLN